MKQTFTNNDLVKFIYKETSAKETLEIQDALAGDFALFDSYQGLMNAYMELPKVTFAPSAAALQNVLNYSSEKTVEA
jgi:hypothetical protein